MNQIKYTNLQIAYYRTTEYMDDLLHRINISHATRELFKFMISSFPIMEQKDI